MSITIQEIQAIQIKYAQFLKKINAPSFDCGSLQALVGEIATRVKVIFNKEPEKAAEYQLQDLTEKLTALQLDFKNASQLIHEISAKLFALSLLITQVKEEPVTALEEEDATIRVNNILIEQKAREGLRLFPKLGPLLWELVSQVRANAYGKAIKSAMESFSDSFWTQQPLLKLLVLHLIRTGRSLEDVDCFPIHPETKNYFSNLQSQFPSPSIEVITDLLEGKMGCSDLNQLCTRSTVFPYYIGFCNILYGRLKGDTFAQVCALLSENKCEEALQLVKKKHSESARNFEQDEETAQTKREEREAELSKILIAMRTDPAVVHSNKTRQVEKLVHRLGDPLLHDETLADCLEIAYDENRENIAYIIRKAEKIDGLSVRHPFLTHMIRKTLTSHPEDAVIFLEKIENPALITTLVKEFLDIYSERIPLFQDTNALIKKEVLSYFCMPFDEKEATEELIVEQMKKMDRRAEQLKWDLYCQSKGVQEDFAQDLVIYSPYMACLMCETFNCGPPFIESLANGLEVLQKLPFLRALRAAEILKNKNRLFAATKLFGFLLQCSEFASQTVDRQDQVFLGFYEASMRANNPALVNEYKNPFCEYMRNRPHLKERLLQLKEQILSDKRGTKRPHP